LEFYELRAKLIALHNQLSEPTLLVGYGYNQDANLLEYFKQYEPLRDMLIELKHSLFDNLPIRKIPEVSKTSEFEGRGSIRDSEVTLLFRDIQYCLDILANLPNASMPSMKVTKEGVFFAGQYFDALQKVVDILSTAKKEILLIDSYISETVFDLLKKKDAHVSVAILTKSLSPTLKTIAIAFNKQYSNLSIRSSMAFHDRFLIIDDTEFYHIGASIKDLGHRGFMFSRIEEDFVLNALRSEWKKEWAASTIEVKP
jgi:hypothetical protein